MCTFPPPREPLATAAVDLSPPRDRKPCVAGDEDDEDDDARPQRPQTPNPPPSPRSVALLGVGVLLLPLHETIGD